MAGKGARAGKGHTPRPIEIVHFPKRGARVPDVDPLVTEEIHTERVERDSRDTLVEERTTDVGGPALDQHTTERELRTLDLQLLTPQESLAALGHLEHPAATLAYHRARLREMVATTPPDRPLSDTADLSLFAHSLLEQGRLAEARVVFEGIVAREPDVAFPYSMLGSVFLAVGDDERALALFEAALQIDAHDPAARLHRAEVRLRKGEATQALRDLDDIVARDPDAREELTLRAQALKKALPKKAPRRK